MKKTKKLVPFTVSLTVLLILLLLVFFIKKIDSVETTKRIDYSKSIQKEKLNEERKEELARSKEEQNKKYFIKTITPIAQQIQKEYHILASITIAQACLESDWGRSQLSTDYHNYFGVKGTGQNNTVSLETKEFINGKWIKKHDNFVVYRNLRDSVVAHAELLKNGTSWNSKQYQEVLNAKEFREASRALYKAGYATDPTYAEKLIAIINKYKLNQYDN